MIPSRTKTLSPRQLTVPDKYQVRNRHKHMRNGVVSAVQALVQSRQVCLCSSALILIFQLMMMGGDSLCVAKNGLNPHLQSACRRNERWRLLKLARTPLYHRPALRLCLPKKRLIAHRRHHRPIFHPRKSKISGQARSISGLTEGRAQARRCKDGRVLRCADRRARGRV